MPRQRSATMKEESIYVYQISLQKREERLVITDTHQGVLYYAGTVYHKPSLHVVPWTGKKKKEISAELYAPRSRVWVVPINNKMEWMYPEVGKPGAVVRDAYALPQNVYDLLRKEYFRRAAVYHKIAQEKQRSGPSVRTSLGLLPPPPRLPPFEPHLSIPLEEKIKKK